jgi:hypothetical protein
MIHLYMENIYHLENLHKQKAKLLCTLALLLRCHDQDKTHVPESEAPHRHNRQVGFKKDPLKHQFRTHMGIDKPHDTRTGNKQPTLL